MNAIDDYLAGQPEPQRATLTALRATIAALLPRAEESIAYGAPAWKVDGTAWPGSPGFAKHCAYLPFSGAVTETLARRARGVHDHQGVGHLRRRTARCRRRSSSGSWPPGSPSCSMVPDAKGVARDFYPDGGLKAKGRIKDGELHGDWSWWRKDGSLLRTGSFDRGRQVGTWTTYDASGIP